MLILPETLSVLSLLSFFLNILEGTVGQAEIPHTQKKSFTLSCTPSSSPSSSPCGSHSVSLLTLVPLRHTYTNTHTHVRTVAAPPRQVNRCVTAQTSTEEDRTDLFPGTLLFLPFLFIGGPDTLSTLSAGPFNDHDA